MASPRAQTAAVATFLVDLNDLSFHALFPLSAFCRAAISIIASYISSPTHFLA
jgi:hypothetical protein